VLIRERLAATGCSTSPYDDLTTGIPAGLLDIERDRVTLDTVCGRVDPIWLCVNREWDLLSGGLGRSKDDGCRGIMAVA